MKPENIDAPVPFDNSGRTFVRSVSKMIALIIYIIAQRNDLVGFSISLFRFMIL